METYCQMDKLTQECVGTVSLSDIVQKEGLTRDGAMRHVKNKTLLPGRYYYRRYPVRERFNPNAHNRPVEIVLPSGRVRRFASVGKLASIELVSRQTVLDAIKDGTKLKGKYKIRYWDGVE